MCEFCENIPVIKKLETFDDELSYEDKKTTIEKVVIVRYKNKLRFYGFNKYRYEDDALYENLDVFFCPVCGCKLS